MHPVEVFKEGAVCYLGGVVDDLESFCVCFSKVRKLTMGELEWELGKYGEQRKEMRGKGHTTSTTGTNTPITRTLRITTNITHLRLIQTLSLKFLPEHMFDAPEATCCEGCFRGCDVGGDRGIGGKG